jgi:hypothetical protein
MFEEVAEQGEDPMRSSEIEKSYSLAAVVAVAKRTSPEEHYHWPCKDRACMLVVGVVVVAAVDGKEDIAEACLIREMEHVL